MRHVLYVGGVDPGLVHTGVVGLAFNPFTKRVEVKHHVVIGPDVSAVKDWFDHNLHQPEKIFIEGYRPRSHFGTDTKMVEAVSKMRALPNSEVLNNTGVKKVVKRKLLELLHLWSFSTPTHHADLRSAARIAVLGMLKDPEMNKLLSEIVRDHLNGDDWHVEY